MGWQLQFAGRFFAGVCVTSFPGKLFIHFSPTGFLSRLKLGLSLANTREAHAFLRDHQRGILGCLENGRANQDEQFRSFACGGLTLEKAAQQRNVFEKRHAGLGVGLGIPDEASQKDGVAVTNRDGRTGLALGGLRRLLARGSLLPGEASMCIRRDLSAHHRHLHHFCMR